MVKRKLNDNSVMNKKFTKKDAEKLERHLSSVSEDSMDLAELDGFLSALICIPETIRLSEYLPYIYGEDHDFGSKETLRNFLKLFLKLWNEMSRSFRKSLDNVENYHTPFYFDQSIDGENHTSGTLWAIGFMKGVSLRPQYWGTILNDKDFGGAIVPIIVLAGQNHHDPELRTDKIPEDKEPEFTGLMIAGLNVAYKYFSEMRDPLIEAEPVYANQVRKKERPNDPCSCGSGIKYKKCCLNKGVFATGAKNLH